MVIPIVTFFLFSISSCEKYISLARSQVEAMLPQNASVQPIEIYKTKIFDDLAAYNELLPPPPPPPLPASSSSYSSPSSSSSSSFFFPAPAPASEEPKQTEDIKIEPVEQPAERVNDVEMTSEIFIVVEEMPTFPGGDKELMKFINSKIVYPETAKTNNIQGRVILRFAVLATGKIGKISVLKSVDPSLDNEAMRVIGSLPDWTPGRQGGKPVNVWYSVPVTFQMR
jgi:protein TonB